MRGAIYRTFRKIFKLPRPNEIWPNEKTNSWNLLTIYLYQKMCMGRADSHIGNITGKLALAVAISTWLEVKGIDLGIFGNIVFIVIGSVVVLSILGHIDIALGVMKKETKLSNTQNEDIVQIRETVKEIDKDLARMKSKVDEIDVYFRG